MPDPTWLPGLPGLFLTLCLAAPPLLFTGAALAARRGGLDAAFRRAHRAALLACAAAAGTLVMVLLSGAGSQGLLRADLPGALMALLVAFIGAVILRYARSSFDGEPKARAGAVWIAATLAAVSLVVAADHLLVVVGAWSATSLALHRLLLFFDERPAARITAHKKFLFGRLADLLLLAAVALLGWSFDTLSITALIERVPTAGSWPVTAHAGMVLLVAAVLLKCAQLPFHGWLIQVMEAPTAVSALLHAGVVNLGGFVLVRLSPLLAEAPLAQSLLLAVGGATAVLAALVMATRISVKVMLAWSTAAQMGFMLLQIALGLPEMAMLHLLAHSLYKAHAFLGAGGAVRREQVRRLGPPPAQVTGGRWLSAAMAALALTAAAGMAWGLPPASAPALSLMATVVAFALLPALLAAPAGGGWRWLPLAALPFVYFGLHALMTSAWPAAAMPAGDPAPWMLVAVALAFAALHVVQAALAIAPQGRFARHLYPWFYGGLFLDERVSRVVLRLFPLPTPRAAPNPLPGVPS